MTTLRERFAEGAVGTLTLRPPPEKPPRAAPREERP
jgi:hypothetical protein